MLLKLIQTPKGRGLAATCNIQSGTIVEVSPTILIPRSAAEALEIAGIDSYPFIWDDFHLALAMGLGSFFNHSYVPNAEFDLLEETQQIKFSAIKNILQGEEVSINYNGDPKDQSLLWFEVK
ncbi:MAG: SET domain-containing protein-lysine N-methyltransferase [Candidatus Paceibacterota bacterium]|jgi:hypothetical protein